MSYAVKEIFFTLQGEGAQSGRAAVFCRFVSFSAPRRVARRSPPWSSTWAKLRSKCSPRFLSNALPLALRVARLARRKAFRSGSSNRSGLRREACGQQLAFKMRDAALRDG